MDGRRLLTQRPLRTCRQCSIAGQQSLTRQPLKPPLPATGMIRARRPAPSAESRRVVPKDWLEGAQLVSSAAAAVGLLLTSWQMVRTRRVADLQALQKFFESADARETALANAENDARTQAHSFNEFLNFLEVYASAHNMGLFGAGSEEMVRHKLEDCYIELDAATEWHPQIAAALDRSTTFAELIKFIRYHGREIDARKAERARLVRRTKE
jgi:hypothetical protein